MFETIIGIAVPAAVIAGSQALKYALRHPDKKSKKQRR